MRFNTQNKGFSGFTLIELLVAIAVIGILSAIAIPAYSDYVLRGKLIEATNTLQGMRASMEQYYQDNRTYLDSGAILSPCNAANLATLKYFTLSCPTQTATTYTLTATGSNSSTTGFVYSITNNNVQTSTVGSNWGGASYTCWITKKGTTC